MDFRLDQSTLVSVIVFNNCLSLKMFSAELLSPDTSYVASIGSDTYMVHIKLRGAFSFNHYCCFPVGSFVILICKDQLSHHPQSCMTLQSCKR